jgi:hypothetical protein
VNLMVRKMLTTFLAVFLPLAITGLIGQLDAIIAWASGQGDIDFNVMRAVLVSLLVGAAAAGVRAVLAYFLSLTPTDALHGPGTQKGQEVRVEKKPDGNIVWGP